MLRFKIPSNQANIRLVSKKYAVELNLSYRINTNPANITDSYHSFLGNKLHGQVIKVNVENKNYPKAPVLYRHKISYELYDRGRLWCEYISLDSFLEIYINHPPIASNFKIYHYRKFGDITISIDGRLVC
jgi:hypothetical protein